MTMSNSQRVGDALALLSRGLQPFVERELQAVWGEEWPVKVMAADPDATPDSTQRVSLADVQFQLRTMWFCWNDVFRRVLGSEERNLVSELRKVRNRWAHQESFSTDDAYRALDSVQRLLSSVSAEEADSLEEAKQELLRIRYEEYSRRKSKQVAATLFETAGPAGLKPWREVVRPHDDVAGGRYQQAEFAADLHQVYQGSAAAEYQDAPEFFRRTFITEGLRRLLLGAIERLSGRGGDPVIDLQTNFGGGKTHSLLALYHLVGGMSANQLPGVDALLREADAETLPHATRAVLVGTKLAPGSTHTKPDGTEVRTLWGELAWQLGACRGEGPAAYALVADADRTATNPGLALEELFRRYGPCLVLIDEWVAYARQLYDAESLPAGSFDTHFTFAQALTEAASAVPGAMVVISIPASVRSSDEALADIEIGGTAGKLALERLRDVIGRKDSPWQPASAEEGFEIVRRRLFEPLDPQAAREREAIAKVFREHYAKNKQEFPPDCGEGGYERRIVAAYPIHPELFDRLYEDWSTLARFQRTRGVLRLMANVIHELWESGDAGPLIMPASVPLSSPTVSFELTRYLSEAWKPVIDSDVDGAASLPLRLDQENPNFGRLKACRRAARTLFLGSAATVKSPNKGMDIRQLKLGCVLPGESPAIFGDALRRMGEHSTHLYVEGGRYWFDTQTSIIQTANDRAAAYGVDDVHAELLKHLREHRKRGELAGLHIAPASSAEVPDEDSVRLVVLGPEYAHAAKAGEESRARKAAAELLESRGNSPRRYRNMVVFLAADATQLVNLEAAVRQLMAWESIERDRESLDLTPFFQKQAEEKRKSAFETVRLRIPETYVWLLVPEQRFEDGQVGLLSWSQIKVTGSGELGERVARKMVSEEMLIPRYSGVLLRRELDRIPLWPVDVGHINTRQLWDYFAQYLYLPRLRDAQVLAEAIRDGAASLAWSSDTFAYAQAWDPDPDERSGAGRYQGLAAGSGIASVVIDSNSVVVKPVVASRQIEVDRAAREAMTPPSPGLFPTDEQQPLGSPTADGGSPTESVLAAPSERLKRRFFGIVDLDPTRLNKQVPDIAELVVQHLAKLPSADVRVTLEIHADVPEGVPGKVIIDVSQNAKDLKFSDFEFEEE